MKQRGKGLSGINPKIEGTEPAVGKGRDAVLAFCLTATSGYEGMREEEHRTGNTI